MGNDFDSIGIKGIKKQEDTARFYHEHLNCVNEFTVNGEKFVVISDGEGMELFFYGDRESIGLRYCELYYAPSTVLNVQAREWVAPHGDSGRNFLQVLATDYEIPLNICVPDFYMRKNIPLEDIKQMKVICFFERFSVYNSEEEYYARENGKMAAESLIPCGTFSLKEREKDFEPNNTIIISGRISKVEKKINRLGGGEFYVIFVECLGATFEVVVEASAVSEDGYTFLIGGIFSGVLSVVGKIVE